MKNFRTLALCVPLALLLGACASSDTKPKPPPPQKVFQNPGKAVVTVAPNAGSGASVVLESTQELRVELANSSWSVANNYDWVVAEVDTAKLSPLGSRFERSARDVNPLESDGITTWRIKPLAPGQTTLSFGLRRPYSTGAALQTVTFDVTIR
ncbi:MAG: protease inhibitor I42 family protein [Solirubrobacteraceae bacterium]|nr:protease inhibitor I42 family protein [Solirubrobacteraceae bacterium]